MTVTVEDVSTMNQGGFPVGKIGLYMRVSSVSQSVDSQREELRKYARHCGYTESELVEYTDTITGISRCEDRNGMSQLMKDIFEKKITQVIVYDLSRIGRSLRECLNFVDHIKEHTCKFVSIKQSLDTSTPSGLLCFNLFSCISSWEREMTLARTQAGIANYRSRHGKWGRPSTINDSVKASVRLLRDKKMSIKEISKHLKIGVGSVYRILQTPVSVESR